MDKVGYSLCLVQAQLAIHEGSPGELARSRWYGSGSQTGFHDQVGRDPAAMTKELDTVFAGVALGGQHGQGYDLIHILTRFQSPVEPRFQTQIGLK
jgi:hypothetical protein